MLHVSQRLFVLPISEGSVCFASDCGGNSGRACTRSQTHRSPGPPDSLLTILYRDPRACTQNLRLVSAYHTHRLSRPVVVLQISLRRTAKWFATESTAGRICERFETLRSLADLDSSSIPHAS